MTDENDEIENDDGACTNCGGHGGTNEHPCWSCSGSGRSRMDDFYARIDRERDADR